MAEDRKAPGSRDHGEEGSADDPDESGYQASVNQARDEPIPASHHDQRRQGPKDEQEARDEDDEPEHDGSRPGPARA
jgi:hypothetical protein